MIMTPVILVFAELIPKCIFRTQADSIALHIAGPLRVAQRLLYVIIAVASRITRMLLWLTRGADNSVGSDVTRRELQALAQIGEEHGVFAPQTRLMLQSAFDLSDRLVGTVMVPFKRMVAVPAKATVEQIEELTARTGYSHFPVYQDRPDNIVGIVNLTDVMYGSALADSPIESAIRREVTRIAPHKSVGALLTEFRYSQVPLAIVMDKDGRALGLLSPQDLLEEIVGTIRDEGA
jgi:CBS domain containing-hemolysin-like protein